MKLPLPLPRADTKEAAEVVPTRWRRHHLVPTTSCPQLSPVGSGQLGLLHVEVPSVGYFRLMWKWKKQRRRRT